MSRAWLFLVLLLCLAACPVEARGAGGHGGGRGFRGGGGKEPWWQVVLQIIGGMIAGFVALAICQCVCRFCCKACCGCDLDDDSDSEVGVKRGRADVEQQGNQRSYLYQGPSHKAGTNNYSSVKEKPTNSDVTTTISASEPLLPAGQVVTVQMVDEQLNKMEVPPAELTLTNLNKLIADLSLYSGLPDIQGVLVKSNYGGFFEMTDLQMMPRGNLKVRAVFSGDRHMLRIYPEPQAPE